MSKLPPNTAALEAERTRATKAFRRAPHHPAADTDNPSDVHRRRRLLLDLERPYGGDAA